MVLRLQPLLIPVHFSTVGTALRFGSSLKDELRNILVVGARKSSVAEVFDHLRPKVSNRSKVESIATRIKRQDHVEFLNENRARLMDGTDNGLARFRELFQESNNRKR